MTYSSQLSPFLPGPLLMISNMKVEDMFQSEQIAVPADHAASGFYISNTYNTVIGNAASGGWYELCKNPFDALSTSILIILVFFNLRNIPPSSST